MSVRCISHCASKWMPAFCLTGVLCARLAPVSLCDDADTRGAHVPLVQVGFTTLDSGWSGPHTIGFAALGDTRVSQTIFLDSDVCFRAFGHGMGCEQVAMHERLTEAAKRSWHGVTLR